MKNFIVKKGSTLTLIAPWDFEVTAQNEEHAQDLAAELMMEHGEAEVQDNDIQVEEGIL